MSYEAAVKALQEKAKTQCVCSEPECKRRHCCHRCGAYVGPTSWEGVPTYVTGCRSCSGSEDEAPAGKGG